MPSSRTRTATSPSLLRPIAASLGVFALSTIGAALCGHFDLPVSSPPIYVLGVTVIGALTGLRGGLAAAIAASLIFNFFMVDPVLQFTANSADEWVPVVAFNLCAVVSGLLAGRLNDRARIAERAQARLNILRVVSDRLQKVVLLPDLVAAMNSDEIRPWLGHLALYDADGRAIGGLTEGMLSEAEAASHYRLEQAGRPIGTAIFGDPEEPSDSRIVDLDAIIALIAMTIERCLLLQQLSQAEAIRRSEELKTALLSSLSHDMRTPLSAIATSVSSLLSLFDDLDPDIRLMLLKTIQEQGARLDRYTANLLDLGRLQAGIDPHKLVDVDVVETLGAVLRSARELAETHGFTKQFDVPSALVRANPVMVEQIFRNILDNAVRYSEAGSTVAIRLSTSSSSVRVEIIDQGCGVPSDELPRLFDRFYRSSRTAHQEGNGLGLSIAKGFVDLFGGSIAVDSPHAGGIGTQVTIEIPLSPAGEIYD